MKLVMMGGPKDGVEVEYSGPPPPVWKFLKEPPPIDARIWNVNELPDTVISSVIITYYRSHRDMDNPNIVYYSTNIKGVPFLGRRKMG